MREIAFRVMSRVSLDTRTEESRVSSTPRNAQKRNSAMPTLTSVSSVRTLLRLRLAKTSEVRFILSPGLGRQHALFEVENATRPLGGVRIVRHHDDRLLEFLIEAYEQVEDLVGRL